MKAYMHTPMISNTYMLLKVDILGNLSNGYSNEFKFKVVTRLERAFRKYRIT